MQEPEQPGHLAKGKGQGQVWNLSSVIGQKGQKDMQLHTWLLTSSLSAGLWWVLCNPI